MKTTIVAATAAFLAFAPLSANAQATGEKMQGSPNAAGMSKSDTADGQSSSGPAPSEQVKGPPNANGATKDDGKKD